MKKSIYFDSFDRSSWPPPSELEPYFLAPPGREWSYLGGNDSWGLAVQGLYGTGQLEPRTGRVDVRLYMSGNPAHGVNLMYDMWDGRTQCKCTYSSKGELARLPQFVRTLHGTPISIGLFIPFAEAWKAVKEFMETEGELPKSIEWIANKDLPPNTFPDP